MSTVMLGLLFDPILLKRINWNFANYIPTIFLAVFAVRIVILSLIFELAVFDHQFVF